MVEEKINWTEELISTANELLRKLDPIEIVEWAISRSVNPIVTTNFRPYEGAILFACTAVKPEIPVIWCDTGYNTPQTYRCADRLIAQLNLNIDLFVPKQTVAYRDVQMGIPDIADERHAEFTYQVKLEPFQRAMQIYQPDVWFTNLRKGQTAHRDKLDILSLSNDGILKVSPFYYMNDTEMEDFMAKYDLPNEFKYYDPTKALENRECGLHI